ncbi:hypothetical protein HQQ94_17215 [Shewanella sp. VB17]|uniref:hypothetical protein n=1 Tax=Shewanella sp. VB17 TaxID=2739432 RepID=UPI0015647A47|nr:hypothetical protein [Shewanella sp. VB17]NRD74923.1 hypothetical protein [Shewanella sp. VB17]
MNIIKPDSISFTTHHLHMCFKETGSVLSSGTGFIYKYEADFYLITNWHNVSGKNPITGKCLSDTLAVPDFISTLFREIEQPANCKREPISLFNDSLMMEPVWYEHPEYTNKVDVVAIPISKDISTKYKLFPINEIEFGDEYNEEVADDVFVIGYPFSDMTYLQMPIWKKASIATEPDINIEGLPKILIDTATRSGLSGSPAIMQRIGIHGMVDGKMLPATSIGRVRNFLGVYSGRVGDDEFKAQLGVVWKARVIDEIITAKKIGTAPCLV